MNSDCEFGRKILANGVRLAWMNAPHLHGFAAVAKVLAGSAYNRPDECGASHFLEHLHMSSTLSHPTREAFRTHLATRPWWFDADTGPVVISYRVYSDPVCGADAVNTLMDVVEPREFDPGLIEEERRLLLDEMRIQQDGFLGGLSALLFKRETARAVAGGGPADFRCLSCDTLHQVERAVIRPERMAVAVSGSCTDGLLEQLESRLSALRSIGSARPDPTMQLNCEFPRFVRTHPRQMGVTVLAFALPRPIPARDLLVVNVIGEAFSHASHPLFTRTRYGNSATYAFGLFVCEFPTFRVPVFVAQLRGAQRDHILRAICGELGRARAVTSEPLEWLLSAKARSRLALLARRDVPHEVAELLAGGEIDNLLGEAHENAWQIDGVDSISENDVREVARKYFAPEHMAVVFPGRTKFFDTAALRQLVLDSIDGRSAKSA